MTTRRLVSGAIGLILAMAVLGAPEARAGYDPVASGVTRLTLARPFAGLLRSHGIRLSAAGGAGVKADVASFPVSGGRLDPVGVRGTIEHAGSIVFSAGGHSLPLRGLTLKTTRAASPLAAKLGGGQLKLAATSKLTTERSGFGLSVRVAAIRLSAKAAERLDKKLGLRGVFRSGQLLGSAATDAQPASVAIKNGGVAELSLSSGLAAKLGSLFVAVNPIFPAEHLGAPFTLPIVGGQIAPDATDGVLEASGSLELIQQGGGRVVLADPWVDLGAGSISLEVDSGPAPPLAGALGRIPALGYLSGTASAEPATRTIAAVGSVATLSAGTAQLLNEAFAAPQGRSGVFAAGEALGGLAFTAEAE